jgi:hypothetical protein
MAVDQSASDRSSDASDNDTDDHDLDAVPASRVRTKAARKGAAGVGLVQKPESPPPVRKLPFGRIGGKAATKAEEPAMVAVVVKSEATNEDGEETSDDEL